MGGAFQLFNDDAVDWLGALTTGSVPLVILDPGVPGRSPRRTRRGAPAVPAFPEERLPDLLYEVYRLLGRDGLCWWVTEGAHAFRAAHFATRLGFAIGAPLIWDRGDGPGARMAFVLPLTRVRPRSPGGEIVVAHRFGEDHAALPIALATALIEWGSTPGATVVDPFMGSGAVGLAALTSARGYLGNDLMPAPRELPGRLSTLAEAAGANGDDEREASATSLARSVSIESRSLEPTLGMQARGQLTIFGDGAELR
jgi:site-specific DNA-methyltransferase (adenine-specific)